MALSCEEIHEQITAYVDDRVDEKEYRQKVVAHIESCTSCRDEYEREIMTKMVIRQRFPRIGTPSELRSSIEEGLDNISYGQSSPRHSSYRSRRSSPQRSVFFLLIVIAGLATYIILFNDSSSGPAPDTTVAERTPKRVAPSTSTRKATGPANPFNMAMENFESVRRGDFRIEQQTGDLAQLKSFFSQKGVPTLAFTGISLPLKGGSVITQDGVPLPHIVYSDSKTYFYLFEISPQVLQSGKGVYVTEDVAQKLSAGETVLIQVSSDVNLIMYKNGEAVEVAIANSTPNDMKRMLGLSVSSATGA